jgi:hypothetical protein
LITECNYGAVFDYSCPMLYGNEITYCRFYGLHYIGHCGGNCARNRIAHNDGIGVRVYADPPLAAPDFNGGKVCWAANDFFDNGGPHISYAHTAGQAFLVAQYNYWGSDCPDSSEIFEGEVIYSPWVDSTHTQILNEDLCEGSAEPTSWGRIKMMFR